jgi:serine/threonine protein kinase
MEEEIKKIANKHNFNIKNYSVLGKGGYGIVYCITVKDNKYAWKIVKVNKKFKDKNKLNEGIKSVENEFAWSRNISSKYCIRTFSIFKDEEKNIIYYSLVMEYALFSDLKYFTSYFYEANLLKLNNKKELFQNIQHMSLLLIKFILYQLIHSLLFLKEHHIVHCDIKAENILICSSFLFKLGDFSVMKVKKEKENIKLNSSTWNIKGPEYYNIDKTIENDICYQIDIYSIGLIIYFIYYYQHIIENNLKDFLKDNKRTLDEKKQIIKEKIHDAQNKINNDDTLKNEKEFKDLLISLFKENINERPNVESLLVNKWINKDLDIIEIIKNVNENEEIKFFLELQKYKKKKKKRKKFSFQKKITIFCDN